MLDTPPSALNRVQLHHKDYYETSGFSPVSREVLVITTLVPCEKSRLSDQ